MSQEGQHHRHSERVDLQQLVGTQEGNQIKNCDDLSLTKSNIELKHIGSSIHDLVVSHTQVFCPSSENQVPEEPWKYVDPPDVGYSWVVLFCCVILQFGVGVICTSVSLLYVEWINEFQKGEGVTSWITTSQQCMLFLLGPITGIMVDKLGDRTTIMIGCLGAGLCSASASLATSYEGVLITYGPLTGVFLCCILVPTTVTAASYFQKYRVLALTISTCCFPLVYMVISPIMTQLIQLYGWRIANIWSAGAILQTTVFAALIRPQRLKKAPPLKPCVFSSSEFGFGKLRKFSQTHSDDIETGDEMETHIHVEASCHNEEKIHAFDDGNNCLKLHPPAAGLSDQGHNAAVECLIPEEKTKMSQGHKVKSLLSSIQQHPVCHWRMAVLLLSNLAWGWGAATFYLLLADHAKSRGINRTEVGQLFMIVGGLGFGGRFGTVIFCRIIKEFSKGTGTLVSMVAQCGALLGLSLLHTFTGFAVMSALHSFAYGVTTALSTPTILEMHGDTHLAIVFGLEMLLYGIGTFISAPFSAYMVGVFGSYTFGFQFSAAVTLLGGLVYLPHILLQFSCVGIRN